MTTPLAEAHALTHAGSLLSGDGMIVAPYDLEMSGVFPSVLTALALPPADFADARRLHLINGFGVTLGDSIIGLTAMFALKSLHPHLTFTIYRPAHAPRYVQRLYELAAPLFGEIVSLPVALAGLPDDEPKIDIGNHLFWPRFASMPMIDFFLWAMSVAPERIASGGKCNRWLADLPLPRVNEPPYALLCADASTPVRSIPHAARVRMVERLTEEFDLPVLGFGAVNHPRYRDISACSHDTDTFFAWIRHARHVVTSDTAALHVAAGFDVPTTAIFTTIAASLRARDYAYCAAIELRLPHLEGVHASARKHDLDALERAYRDYDWSTMPLAAHDDHRRLLLENR
jgi:hypothetical protein